MKVIAAILLLVTICHAQDDVRRPPSIGKGPEKHVVFTVDSTFDIPCEASGSPDPEYEWYKDGSRLDLNDHRNIKQASDSGTLTLEPAYAMDEGIYQCKAANDYGVAISNNMYLQRARMDLATSEVIVKYRVTEGESLMLASDDSQSVPAAKYTWQTAPDKESDAQGVTLDRRVNMDESGNLYFSYVKTTDQKKNEIYKCEKYNSKLDVKAGGCYSSLEVIVDPSAPETVKPSIMYYTGQNTGGRVTAIAGEEQIIKCLFAGKPEVSIDWRRSGSNSLPNHIIKQQYGTELLITSPKKVTDNDPGDEGTYFCKGCNSVGCVEQEIDVKVDTRPTFLQIEDRPRDVNATEETKLEISCVADSKPRASIQWLINGQPFEDVDVSSRYSISDDQTVLTIVDVCKDCPTGGSDLQVIQCNASNEHDYAFSSGYVNVILKTSIVLAPQDDEIVFGEGNNVTLYCDATADDSTPVTIEWLHETKDGDREVEDVPNERYVLDDNTLMIMTPDEESEKYAGKYTCRASNGYSQDTAEAMVTLPGGVLPVTASSFDMWWIFIVIAAVLLLLILLLCCCLYCQRNKGDAYPVDEKERRHGLDPEKELADSGFLDYQRPEGEPMKGSRASLTSTIKLDSDEGSLAEYGDLDTGKFNEDGSFLGLYGTDKKKRPPTESNV